MIITNSRVTVGEFVESLDKFYAEPINRPIPIVSAMNWTRLKANGASESELKDYETQVRKASAK